MDRRVEAVPLVVEILIKTSLGNAGCVRDSVKIGAVVGMIGEFSHRRVENTLPFFFIEPE